MKNTFQIWGHGSGSKVDGYHKIFNFAKSKTGSSDNSKKEKLVPT